MEVIRNKAQMDESDVPTEEVLWSSKAVRMKTNYGKWYNIYDASVGLFEKVIIAAGVLFAIYNFIENGIGFKTLLLMLFVMLAFWGIDILVKLKFEYSKYILTKNSIQIGSWSLFGGRKMTKIDIDNISKTYLLQHNDDIGTILLYCDKIYERPTDLINGSTLETIAIQYISDPKNVKNMIDQIRNKTI